jgi:hypothetical protein
MRAQVILERDKLSKFDTNTCCEVLLLWVKCKGFIALLARLIDI